MLHTIEHIAKTFKLPYMQAEQAEWMSRIIQVNRYNSVLELGTYHGVSTCYLANAMYPFGRVTTIDMPATKDLKPNVKDLADMLGFKMHQHIVALNEDSTFNWTLTKLIEQRYRCHMVYIDGGHRLEATGLAFYLCDQLLLPGGCLVIDDLNWRYADNITPSNAAYVSSLPAEEKNAQQVRRVWETLVKPHPSYYNFQEIGEWPSGVAYKKWEAT